MDFELVKANYEEGKIDFIDYVNYLRLIKKLVDVNPNIDLISSVELIKEWVKYKEVL